MRRIVRVLAIPQGQDKDAEGRQLGDDWMLATLGYSEELRANIYLTTDRLRADEEPAWLADPGAMARAIAAAINEGRLP